MGAELGGLRAWIAVVGIPAVLGGCGSAGAAVASPAPRSAVAAPRTGGAVLVTVPGGDRFAPVAVSVAPPEVITFHNADADAHTVTSLPGDPTQFDIILAPGESRTLVLATPGIHRYYCRLHARYDASTDQVAALRTADHPDEPMAGVLVVTQGTS